MLFSGTFFPITQLPAWVRPVAYATPLWHGVALCRALSLGTVFASTGDAGSAAVNAGYLVVLAALGLWWASRAYRKRLYV
jgi:lipooligosaccharide transport system permease protein